MKTLLIMRHAKSSWKDEEIPDHDRPLTKRGQRNAPRMGRLLREVDQVPDLILSSSAKRAIDTAEAVADQSHYQGEVQVVEELYAAPPEAYIQALEGLTGSYERVMVVGHNPGLEELLDILVGKEEALPTGAVAQVALPIQSWQELTIETGGQLVNLWRPKELP
jgi:phosphohistidine phosphatase